MSAEGQAMFSALKLIRERARAVGRWRDDVKIAMGEERVRPHIVSQYDPLTES